MKAVAFKNLKVGEAFTLADPSDPTVGEGRLKYVNIKIKSSIFAEDNGKELVKFKANGDPDYSEGYARILPFNVIALEDGRVRTFFPENKVYPVKVFGKVS